MENSIHAGPEYALRVLLVHGAAGSLTPSVGWLWGQDSVAAPIEYAASTGDIMGLAGRFQPHVVVLDLHAPGDFPGHALALFKALMPAPAVFVLTQQTSGVWRQRCGAMGADAVFQLPGEFMQLAAALATLRQKLRPTHPVWRTSFSL